MGSKLRPKYMTYKIQENGSLSSIGMKSTDPESVDSPFVLMPRKDPAAYYALLCYAQVCEEELAREIRVWLEKVVEAPPVYGTQGERNRVHMKLKQMELIS